MTPAEFQNMEDLFHAVDATRKGFVEIDAPPTESGSDGMAIAHPLVLYPSKHILLPKFRLAHWLRLLSSPPWVRIRVWEGDTLGSIDRTGDSSNSYT